MPDFVPGTLEAIGYISGRPSAGYTVATPLAPAQLILSVDDQGIDGDPDNDDVIVAHASWSDVHGTLCVDRKVAIAFAVSGAAECVGPAQARAEVGIASVVLRLPPLSAGFELGATGFINGVVVSSILRHTPQRQEMLPTFSGSASAVA